MSDKLINKPYGVRGGNSGRGGGVCVWRAKEEVVDTGRGVEGGGLLGGSICLTREARRNLDLYPNCHC